MDGKKILEVIEIYRRHLDGHKVDPIDYPHDQYVRSSEKVCGHCFGMLDKMAEFVRDNRIDKAFRWLGFIQGCFWSLGCYTLEELKNHSRPSDEEI